MIRSYEPADAAAVLAINEANIPAVGDMDLRKLELFGEIASWLKVIEVDGVVVGLLVGLIEGQDRYRSPNYRWFSERNDRFIYVDRVAVAESARNQGWGAKLYDEFAEWGRANGYAVMTAEVNTIPDNPGSHRFHQRYGFVEVGRERPYGANEEVVMYELAL